MNLKQIEDTLQKHNKLMNAVVEQSKAQSKFNTNAANDIQVLIVELQKLNARVSKLEGRMKL